MCRFASLLAPAILLAPLISAQTAAATGTISARAAARLLDQASWGPTPAGIAQVQQLGIQGWLNRQFSLNSSDLPDQPSLDSSGKRNTDLSPVQRAFFQNALSGQDQLRQRVAFALSQIWVVSQLGLPDAYAFPPYWRVFRDNAFGNYRDLMRAVTLNPAMGHYLDMANNNKGNPVKGTSANENYGREMMQLFTLGLNQLNPDGSLQLDSTGQPIPIYTQTVVTNMAKAFTGWTYPTAPGATAKFNNPEYYYGQMFAVEANHDQSAKTIFGNVTIPAGQTAEQDLDSVLDAMMAQPTMAPFVSRQLIQHLVTSNPSPAYVSRVAAVFTDNGSGVKGDLKAVINAILTDPEARAGDEAGAVTDADFGHLREPVLFMASVLRGLNGTLTATSATARDAAAMSEDLFRAPSVFSYFAPGYRTATGLLGPEFQIYSTATAAERANIVTALLYGKLDSGTTVNLAAFLANAGDTGTLADFIGSQFLHGAMSTTLRTAMVNAANAVSTPADRVRAELYVALTSGEYQIVQ